MTAYQLAKEQYGALGIDTERAIETTLGVPISMHCWQGDDVGGFENAGGALTGGIQATGNYPGKARNPEELMSDMDAAFSVIPGKHRINLHASYAIFKGAQKERDALTVDDFSDWIAYAKARGLGIDFNHTFFSHKMVKAGLTLSSPDENVRAFWVRHGIVVREISAGIAAALESPVLCDLWIPDGYKDIPSDRMGPRKRLEKSLDEIFARKYDNVIDAVESKVFGIGLESYTVGSSEFYISYSASRKNVYPLLDNGHFHPTEAVSDKIPALLCFFDKLPLHVTRPVRWDSDHVVRLDDELREIAFELVRCGALSKALIGLDFFDASINRVAAWVIGMRNMQKAILGALLMPWDAMKAMQDKAEFTKLLMTGEEMKTLPAGAVWDELCARAGVPVGAAWFDKIEKYEREVLSKR